MRGIFDRQRHFERPPGFCTPPNLSKTLFKHGTFSIPRSIRLARVALLGRGPISQISALAGSALLLSILFFRDRLNHPHGNHTITALSFTSSGCLWPDSAGILPRRALGEPSQSAYQASRKNVETVRTPPSTRSGCASSPCTPPGRLGTSRARGRSPSTRRRGPGAG